MNRLIVFTLFGMMLTGCANGAIAEMGYTRCAGYEEYHEVDIAHQRAKAKYRDILFAYNSVPLAAVTTEKNGVMTTVLVNPMEDEREATAKELATLLEKKKAFEKTCTLYSW